MSYDQENIFDRESGVLWKDENFDVASYRGVGVDPPDVVSIPGTSIQTVAFDGNATVEDIQVCKELNHDYQEGTPISFHVHWYPTTTASGTVRWQLEYWAKKTEATNTVISGTIFVDSEASGTAWKQQTAMFPDVSLGDIAEIGTQIHFRFFRNPTVDSYPGDAAVATMGYHYKTNSRGSAKMTTK